MIEELRLRGKAAALLDEIEAKFPDSAAVQLYLDQATSPAMGTAINEATIALFDGASTPAKVCQAITDAAKAQ